MEQQNIIRIYARSNGGRSTNIFVSPFYLLSPLVQTPFCSSVNWLSDMNESAEKCNSCSQTVVVAVIGSLPIWSDSKLFLFPREF
ncbi:hypothetical protein NC652_004756 [Populus alba x Populus x berolinensis]|nr:hypothetical protein NC652_004756 [Populus alba x Populus x berolinensis]